MTSKGTAAPRRRILLWLWMAGALAGLAALAVVAAFAIVTPERARGFTQQVLSQALSREVRFASARLSLWPPFGVEVRDLAVSDPGGLRQGTLAAARRVRLGLSLWGLFSGRLQLQGVEVESPRVRLWKDARGRGNWEGLGQPPAAARSTGWNPQLVLRDLRLRDGGLISYGPGRRPELALAGLDVALHQRGAAWRWSVKARRIQTYGRAPAAFGPVNVEGSLQPGRAGEATAFRYLGETRDLVFEGRGSFTPGALAIDKARLLFKTRNASVEDLTARVAFDSTAVRVTRLAGRLGRSPFELSATLAPRSVQGLARAHLDLADVARLAFAGNAAAASGRAQLALRFRGAALDPDSLYWEGAVNLLGVGWQPPDGNTPPLSAVNGRVWADGRVVTVSGLTGRLGPVPFRVSARITRPQALASALDPQRRPDAPTAEVRFDITTGAIDAAKLFPPGKPMAMAPALTAEGIAHIERLIGGRFDARDLVAQVRYDRGVVEVVAASARVYGGSATGSGRFDVRDMKKPAYDLKLQAQALQTGELLAAWTPFPRLLTGTLDLGLGLAGSGMEVRDALPSLTLDGLARAVGGRLSGSPVLAAAARWTGLADLAALDFRDLLWRFRVAGGRMAIAETWIRTDRGDYSVEGEVGLNGDLALAVAAVLPATRLGALPPQVRSAAGFFQDDQGRVLLDFGIGGTVKSPRFSWRTDRAAARFAQRLESELRGRAAPYQQAFEDTLARARAALESRLAAAAERGRKELDEAAEREQKRLEEKAKSWLGGFLPGPHQPAGSDTSAAAPLALPPADSAAVADTAGADTAGRPMP